MTPTPHKDFEALLPPDSAAAQAWREANAQVTPPDALDEAIRAAARRAVKAGPLPAGGGGQPRWRVPLSIAAVVVISGTLTFLVAEREERGLVRTQPADPQVLREGTSENAAKPGDPAARAKLEGPAMSSEPRAPVASPKFVKPRAASERDAERKSRIAIPSAPDPPEGIADQGRNRGSAPLAAPAPSASVASEDAASSGLADSDSTHTPAVAEPPKDETRGLKSLEKSGRVEQRVGPARSDGSTGEELPLEAERGQAPMARTDSPPTADAIRADQGQRQEAAQPPIGAAAQSPQEWLRRIADLRNRGQIKEAERELKAFRERYPGYPLPPELRSLEPLLP